MKDIRMLESVQKFACKVCLKCWDMDYDNMLHCLIINLPCLSERQQYLKLLTMYNIVNGHLFFQKVFLYFMSIIHLSTADHVHTQIVFLLCT